jgi:hypothetical protein
LVEVTNCMDCMFSGFFPLGISQTTWNYWVFGLCPLSGIIKNYTT